jgi:hypothetical protein
VHRHSFLDAAVASAATAAGYLKNLKKNSSKIACEIIIIQDITRKITIDLRFEFRVRKRILKTWRLLPATLLLLLLRWRLKTVLLLLTIVLLGRRLLDHLPW